MVRQWEVSLPENEILNLRFLSPLFLIQNGSTNSAAKVRKQENYWANKFLDSACPYPTFPHVLESKPIKSNRCFDKKTGHENSFLEEKKLNAFHRLVEVLAIHTKNYAFFQFVAVE